MTLAREPVDRDGPLAITDFRRIFDSYGNYVWRVLRRLGVPSADVPDVAQEVFIVLRRKLDRVHSPAALRGFIYGVAVRAASDHRRSARFRYERVAPAPPELSVDAPQEGDLERARARALLEDALGGLDDAKRAVFVLYELEGLEMSEIAEALGCPLQTAYSRLHAARRAVSHAFERAEKSDR